MYATTRGMLLLATPPLDDPNFDRSVIYMMEHTADGAVGLVLNRPTEETAIDGLDLWMELAVQPAVVFDGGPVQADALIALAELKGPREDAWSAILPDLGSVDLARDPSDVADHVGRVRLFRGYAGWAPGQLDDELAMRRVDGLQRSSRRRLQRVTSGPLARCSASPTRPGGVVGQRS